nr:MAG TPA: hypothetical protein [Caudoviricetes sp.]
MVTPALSKDVRRRGLICLEFTFFLLFLFSIKFVL